MAEHIRNTHELATIRVRLRPGRSGLELSFTSYLGTSELERRDVPGDVVGLRPELSVQAYRSATFEVPEHVRGPLVASLLAHVEPDEPCWLEVGASAGHLGVVPWERFFQPALGRPLLRVPNFLADPIFLRERLRAALVVSSPAAKTPFPVEAYTRAVVECVQQAVPQGSELHVFADRAAFNGLKSLATAPPGHSVVVHDPQEAEGYGEGGTLFTTPPPNSPEARLESPWLRWIRGALGGQALDLVHFVSPGFFRRDQGALALARSPGSNEDTRWSHFVGADELIVFLDLVGAWAVGFSPPYENVWAIGLRLLTDRLAWQRPGPLFVHDVEHGAREDVIAVYRYLFAAGEQAPPRTANLSLYTHPRRMQRYRTSPVDAYTSVTRRSFGVRSGEAIPEQLVWLAQKGDRSASASSTRSNAAWAQTNELQLDRLLLQVASFDTPSRRGALDALAEVRRIFDGAMGHDAKASPPTKASDTEGGAGA
jgi:hypothetical protein